eukprot:m.114722 g.114722  ORF g.114722 m.114722 type:complete len:270 (-) comp28368_c0_seq1:319-1128(-)
MDEYFDDPYDYDEDEDRVGLVQVDDNTFSNARKPKSRNKLLLVLAMVTFGGFAIAEMTFGIAGHSLSLAEDASTMLVDALTYGFNLYAEVKKPKASKRKQILYEIVTPAFSAVSLVATTLYITYMAILVLLPSYESDGPEADATVMWIFSSVNLGIDAIVITSFLVEHCKKAKGSGSNANMLSALTHVLIDTLRSLAVMGAAMAASVFNVNGDTADAISAIIVTVLTLLSTIPLFKILYSKVQELKKLKKSGSRVQMLQFNPPLESPDI